MAPDTTQVQGKTAVVKPSLGACAPNAQSGPDLLPDSWGEWLQQNAKGRVRVIGGLQANEPQNMFLGNINESPPACPDTWVGPQVWNCSDDYELAAALCAQARDVRECMSQHIRAGTIDPDSKTLADEGRTLYNKVKALKVECAARKDALEDKYLTGAPSTIVEEIATIECQHSLLERELEQWEAVVPPLPVAPPGDCCSAKCGHSPRKAFVHRHLRV